MTIMVRTDPSKGSTVCHVLCLVLLMPDVQHGTAAHLLNRLYDAGLKGTAGEKSVEDTHPTNTFFDVQSAIMNSLQDDSKPLEDILYTYQVSLQKDGHHGCGGSIIDAEWIVTAGHCCFGYNPEEFQIYAGVQELSKKDEGQELAPEKLIVHPEFRNANPRTEGAAAHDICLIKLKSPIEFIHGKTSLIPLPRMLSDPSTKSGIVSGWGWPGFDKDTAAVVDRLQHLVIDIVSDTDECRKMLAIPGQPQNPAESDICGGTKGATSCHGDSGGPLVSLTFELIGVVSRGLGHHCDRATVFTQVSHYMDWIRNETGLSWL